LAPSIQKGLAYKERLAQWAGETASLKRQLPQHGRWII